MSVNFSIIDRLIVMNLIAEEHCKHAPEESMHRSENDCDNDFLVFTDLMSSWDSPEDNQLDLK